MLNRGIFVNIDINTTVTPFLNRVAALDKPTESDLYRMTDIYAGTQVTDLAFNIFCQYSATPSRIWTDAAAKASQKTENGAAVDYTEQHGAMARLLSLGLDPYDIWLRRCREKGMKAWLSIRANDCHCPDDDTCFLRSDFFYTARERGWMAGNEYGYYRWCFDYAVPGVRERMLAYISEQLGAYDCDGLEMDWLREPTCVDYRHRDNGTHIITGFMRELKKIVSEAEKHRGHKIAILCHVPRDNRTCLGYGLDPVGWANEGLCDIIAPAPRWESCDSDIPIDEWKRLLPDTPVWAGLELLLNHRMKPGAYSNAETTRGYAGQYFAQGADKLYLFNYFHMLDEPHPCNAAFEEIYRTCGDPAMTTAMPRRNVVTYQDITPDGIRYDPLPLTVSTGRTACLTVAAGPVAEDALLLIGLDAEREPPAITADGDGCSYIGISDEPCEYCPAHLVIHLYRLPACISGRLFFVFAADTDTAVRYVEIRQS
jgi:hypothetical protein